MKEVIYGAPVERGIIVKKENNKYTVMSLTRNGIVSLPMGAIGNNNYNENDMVYFFLFEDGNGLILSTING